MTYRERANELADEIYRQFTGARLTKNFHFEFYPQSVDLVVRALRAYADTANDAEIGRSIVSAIGRQVDDSSSPIFEWSPAERWDEVIGDLVEMVHEARKDAHAISAAGYVIRPREPTEADILADFGKHKGWTLNYKCPIFADDDDTEQCWQILEEFGGLNDREWRVKGKGDTPADAIRAALATESGHEA